MAKSASELLKSMSEKDLNKLSEDEIDFLTKEAEKEMAPNEESPIQLGEPLQSFGKGLMKFAEGVGTALDYPVAPIRGGITKTAEVLKGKAKSEEIPRSIYEPLLAGPGVAPSPGRMVGEITGISEEPIQSIKDATGLEISPAGIVGLPADIALGAGIAKGAGKVLSKGLSGARSLLRSDEQAIRAFGLGKKDISKILTPEIAEKLVEKMKIEISVPSTSAEDALFKAQVQENLDALQSYLKHQKQFAESVGQKTASDGRVLEGLTDDLQRAGTKPIDVELGGPERQKLYPSDYAPETQQELFSLPVRGEEQIFNVPHGDNLMEFLHQIALDERSTKMIPQVAKQGEISGTGVEPRVFSQQNVPGVDYSTGQTSMVFEPQPPPVLEPTPGKKLTFEIPSVSQKEKEAIKFGKENILSANPLKTSTQKVLDKVQTRLESVGKKISLVRDEHSRIVDNFFKNNKNSSAYQEYLSVGMSPQGSYARVANYIDETFESASEAEKVKRIAFKQLDDQFKKYKGQNPNISQLAKLKSEWQKKAYESASLQKSTNQHAFEALEKEARRAMDFEIELMDKIIGGSTGGKHKKLLSEYTSLSILEKGLMNKRASEIGRSFTPSDIIDAPFRNTRVQSTIAKIPESIQFTNKLPVASGLAQTAQDRFIEGFPAEKTIPASPVEIDSEMSWVNGNQQMDSIEKSRRINLLKKHGRIYLGR